MSPEIPKCPTCGRRPSDRTDCMSMRFSVESCADPIHDRADQCEQLTRERDAAQASAAILHERALLLEAERDELRHMVFGMFRMSCTHYRNGESTQRYNHWANSAYREAQAKLIEWGLVKREECVRE